jgi:hypothetical protein
LKAWLNLRHPIAERTTAFTKGLQSLGYEVQLGVTVDPGSEDVLVLWNRIREGARAADAFEAVGRPVLIAENSLWGNDFVDGPWLSLSKGFHNTAGAFPVGGPERWDSLGVYLPKFRQSGETIVLPQRGIGPPEVRMPSAWPRLQKGRLRPHPGKLLGKPLEADLFNAGKVVTWGSGAAVKALLMGIPVESHMPRWSAEQDNTDAGRLAMFRRLAWSQWRVSEIRSGDAFKWMLQ